MGFGGGNISTSETKINAMSIQQSTYGIALTLLFGTTRISGCLLDIQDFSALANTETQGGKGGGDTYSNTTYTYIVNAIIGLCHGVTSGIGYIWNGKSKTSFLAIEVQTSVDLIMHKYPFVNMIHKFSGTNGQQPWGYMALVHPDHALGYANTSYIAGSFDLGSSGSMPNYNFEVYGPYRISDSNPDASPVDIITQLLSNTVYGVGLPAANIGDFTEYASYIANNGLYFSLALTEQSAAQEVITRILEATNANCFWSQGLFKIRPYLDGLSPLFNIGDDHIQDQDNDSLVITRDLTADAYNYQQIEFLNRNNEYNVEIMSASDQANIELYGLRKADVKTHHEITTAAVAQVVAQAILQRGLYIRNQYVFKVGWEFVLLEPLDIISLTCNAANLSQVLMRIVKIEEDKETGQLEITAEEYPNGVATAPIYGRQIANRPGISYNVDPGNVNQPVFFEPTAQLSEAFELWIGTSGGQYWGGTYIWLSTDRETFKQVGIINNPARHGILTAPLPASTTEIDTTHTLSIDLSVSNATLLSGTQADANSLVTICYVDGEIIAYQTATLTGTNKYDLTYLVRGAYGTDMSVQHNTSSQFLRIEDSTIFKYPFTLDRIGQTIYLKFQSYNSYGGAMKTLDDLPVYTYTIQGTALGSTIKNVENVRMVYDNGFATLQWDMTPDFRTPIQYEIRKGPSWINSQIVGRVPTTSFRVDAPDTYWIAACYQYIYNNIQQIVYSETPTDILIGGSRIAQNVISSIEESASNWAGACSGGAIIENNILRLQSGSLTGAYQIPSSHVIQLTGAMLCNVSCAYNLTGINVNSSFDTIADIDSLADWDGNQAQFVSATIQIAVAQTAWNWTDWQDLIAGQYFGRYFTFRVILNSTSPAVYAAITNLTITVDMPDIVDSGNIQIPAAGVSVLYTQTFNVVPYPQITIYNAQAGDDIKLTAQTRTGFTVQIVNGGAGVVRNINWMAKSY